VVFKQMIEDGNLSLDCVFFDKNRWYEVDTLDDLRNAERMSWLTNRYFDETVSLSTMKGMEWKAAL